MDPYTRYSQGHHPTVSLFTNNRRNRREDHPVSHILRRTPCRPVYGRVRSTHQLGEPHAMPPDHKELYGDLNTRTGTNCPCEPEFRAYMILMKLNDCSVLE